MPTRKGSIRLFRLFGIDVYLHWTWFVVALIEIQNRKGFYNSYAWNILEYVGLFLIVLTHEFGHQLACRQVGGQTNQIVLWPLGGVAYVSPPQRPGAVLWSIAAGPLVNVALIPVFFTFWLCSNFLHLPDYQPDVYHFIANMFVVNLVLLCFNMLPFYPLDGGQIFRAILWFFIGRAKSLLVASITGIIGAALLCLGAFFLITSGASTSSGGWFAVLAVFMGFNCWSGFRQARALLAFETAARRPEFSCPSCKTSPPIGEFWRCGRCRKAFDTFLTHSFCPHCGAEYSATACPFCHALRPMAEWGSFQAPPASPDAQQN